MHTQTHILESHDQCQGSKSFPGTPGSWTWWGWTHPVLEVTAPILQQLLELDGAVGHEVVVAYRSIVKDSQLDLAPIAHISDELIVPGRAVSLLLGGCLADARVVHVESNVGVQKESLWPGSHRMAQRPGCGLQAHGLTDFDLKKAIEHYHGRGRGTGAGVTPSAPRAGMKNRQQVLWEPGGLLGPLSPHPTLSLHLVALRPGAGDSQRVHVFPRRIPNGKQGGGRAGDVRFWSKSLPPTTGDTSTGGDKLSPPLQAAGADSSPRWFSGSCAE